MWDFNDLAMSFWHSNHRVCWRGTAGPSDPSILACSGEDLLPALLDEFADVFAKPTVMPPPIPPTTSTCSRARQPVVVRPYRYPVAHKDEL